MTELQKFALENRMFWWWVKDVANLSERSIFEGTLSYGDYADKKRLFQLLGPKKFEEHLNALFQEPRRSIGMATVDFWHDYVRKNGAHA